MVNTTRSSVFAIKKETGDGLQTLTGSTDFIPLRQGFSMSSELETSESDELLNDIAKGKSLVIGENAKGSHPFYPKHSGVQGQEPECGVFYESIFGDKTIAGTEYDTVAGSTTTVIKVDSGEGANFEKGQALFINGYVRNIKSILGDDLTLNAAIPVAPLAGVNLGQAVLYKPSADTVKFSAYQYHSASNSAMKQAIDKCVAESMTLEFPAKDRATGTVEYSGVNYYYNYITISASNKYIDVTDDGGTFAAILSEGTYKTPIAFAEEVETQLNAYGSDTFTCDYSSSTGKFTITGDGSVISLLFLSGTNNANYCDQLGFDKVDETGALTYTSDNAMTFDAPYTPSYDSSNGLVVKGANFLIGDNVSCSKNSNVSVSFSKEQVEVKSTCAENGVEEKIVTGREVTISGTVLLETYEVNLFHRAINNETTQFMFNCGDHTGNVFTKNTVLNIWMEAATITATPIQDQDGYQIIALEAKGFVSSTEKDCYLNWI